MVNAIDKEQIELLSSWWKRYGKFIVMAIIVGVVAGFGFRYWSHQKELYTVRASVAYQSLFDAVAKSDLKEARTYLHTLKQQFPESVYATLGELLQARLYVDNHQYTEALEQLQWVIKHGDRFKNFQQMARIRTARILLEQQHYQDALAVLETIDDKAFKPLINEVSGDIYLAQGDKPKARAAYQAALTDFSAGQVNNPLLKLKMRSL